MEPFGDPAHHQLLDERCETADAPLRRLIANANQDGGRSRDRLLAVDQARSRRDARHDITREPHDEKSDNRVPKPDHVPGERDREQHHQNEIDKTEAVRGQGKD